MLKSKIKGIREQILKAAQSVYDMWDQDDEGWSENFQHSGGICQDIAEAICDVLSKNNIDCFTLSASVGEQHVWSVAIDDATEEAVSIDIPPCCYETGGGYTWRKIKDVQFDNSDLIINNENYEDICLARDSDW